MADSFWTVAVGLDRLVFCLSDCVSLVVGQGLVVWLTVCMEDRCEMNTATMAGVSLAALGSPSPPGPWLRLRLLLLLTSFCSWY